MSETNDSEPKLTWRERLKAKVDDLVTPEETLPTQWADEGGLHYNNGTGVLYAEAPVSVLDPETGALQNLLDELLARGFGGRSVHLSTYSWYGTTAAPPSPTLAHRTYVQQCLRVLTPSRIALIGVPLERTKSDTPEGNTALVGDLIQKALGEKVPDVSLYATERAEVEEVFRSTGMRVPSSTALGLLNNWHTAGAAVKDEWDESDDSIAMSRGGTIEAVAVRTLSDTLTQPVALVPPESGGVVIASIVGELGKSHEPKSKGRAVLSNASVTYVRRSLDEDDCLADSAGVSDDIDISALKMQQLTAVLSTFPCAQGQPLPFLTDLTGEKLHHLGFRDRVSVADPAGLYLGLSGAGFLEPTFLDLLATPARSLAVVGDECSGKTFLCDHLAYQAHLCGRPVVITTDSSNTGVIFGDKEHLSEHDVFTPGLLDPFQHAAEPLASRLATAAMKALLALDAAQQRSLESAIERLLLQGTPSLARLAEVTTDPSLKAALASCRNAPWGHLLFGAAEKVTTSSQSIRVVNLYEFPVALPEEHRSTLTDLACALALAEAPDNALVVFDDGVSDLSDGTALRLVADARGERCPSMVAVSREPEDMLHGKLPTNDALAVLSTTADSAPKLLERLGVEPTPQLMAWLANSHAHIEEYVIVSPAVALMWDRNGRSADVAIGPVPSHLLPELGAALAGGYLLEVLDS